MAGQRHPPPISCSAFFEILLGSRLPEMTGNPPPAAAFENKVERRNNYMKTKTQLFKKAEDILKYLDWLIASDEPPFLEIKFEELVNIRQALYEAINEKKEAQLRWIKSVQRVYEICSIAEKRIFGGFQYEERKHYRDRIRLFLQSQRSNEEV